MNLEHCRSGGDPISKARGLVWQHLRMEMHDPSTCHVVVDGRLLSGMLVELGNGGEPPLTVLEGEGKRWFWLPPLGLRPVMLRRPILLEFLTNAGLCAFGP